MKWNDLNRLENMSNGYAMLKDEEKIYFGEFIDNDFLVIEPDVSWVYHFSDGVKYQYVLMEVVQ